MPSSNSDQPVSGSSNPEGGAPGEPGRSSPVPMAVPVAPDASGVFRGPASAAPLGSGVHFGYHAPGSLVPAAPGAYPGTAILGPDPNKVMDPASLLMAVRRRWFLALSLGLLTAGVAAGTTWYLWPPTLGGAAGVLLVNAQTPFVFEATMVNVNEFNTFKRSQQSLVASRAVLTDALRKPEVAELKMIKRLGSKAIAYLENSIGTDYGSGPERLTVTLLGTDEDKAELPIVLNAIMDSYLEIIVRNKQNHRSGRLQILQELHENYIKILDEKRQTLEVLSQAVGAKDTAEANLKRELAVARLASAKKKMFEFQDKREDLEYELKLHKGLQKDLSSQEIKTEEIDALVDRDPEVQSLLQELGEAQVTREQTAQRVVGGKGSAQYMTWDQEVKRLQRELDEKRAALREDAIAEIREQRQGEVDRKVADLEFKINYSKGYEEELNKTVDLLVHATGEVTLTTAEMEAIRGEIERVQDKASRLGGEIEKIQIELHAGDRVSKLDDPYYFEPTIPRKQYMATWGAGLGAFAMIIFGVGWWEFRARRINTLDEIVHGLGMRVVGALPALPDRGRRQLPARGSAYPNYLIESVDTTRTMLLHAARREGLRTVMVTSARPGEGKTSLSIQLAASLARAGRKTLFIDGDLRNPTANQVFNLGLGPGLAELLRGEADLAGVIQPTSVRGLWMIPAGRWTSQATEILSQEGFRGVADQLKTEFDFVVVDSSPLLAVVDSLLLGQQVDAVLFSILQEVSHAPSVYAAYQRLESLGARILGAVVNGVASNQFGYKSEYYYGSAYGGAAEPANEESPTA